MRHPDNDALFTLLRDWVAGNYPGQLPEVLILRLSSGAKIHLPIPVPTRTGRPRVRVKFRPSEFQRQILQALDGCSMRTDELAAACDCDRRTLFKPSGIKELINRGLVANDPQLGYYRPDAPPEESAAEGA